jgi:hypothetical protein
MLSEIWLETYRQRSRRSGRGVDRNWRRQTVFSQRSVQADRRRQGTRLAVTPLQWRPYFARPKTARRFPAPWTVIENAESFRAQDAGGQTVGWFYFRHNEETARQAKVLTRDEARRMAVNFARVRGEFDRRSRADRRANLTSPTGRDFLRFSGRLIATSAW